MWNGWILIDLTMKVAPMMVMVMVMLLTSVSPSFHHVPLLLLLSWTGEWR